MFCSEPALSGLYQSDNRARNSQTDLPTPPKQCWAASLASQLHPHQDAMQTAIPVTQTGAVSRQSIAMFCLMILVVLSDATFAPLISPVIRSFQEWQPLQPPGAEGHISGHRFTGRLCMSRTSIVCTHHPLHRDILVPSFPFGGLLVGTVPLYRATRTRC